MKKYIGYYNSMSYRVGEIDEQGNETEVYQAGNSPFESQVYTTSEKGVGLEQMKKWCEQTTRETAESNEGEYLGLFQLGEDE